MDKEHRGLVAVLVAVVMTAALFSAFSLNLFHQTPAVVLPSLSPLPTEPVSDPTEDRDYQRVEVTPATVQSVVASLDRPDSYARTVTVETRRNAGSFGITAVSVAADGGWTQVEAVLPDGRTAWSVLGDGKRYLWYDRDTVWQELEAGPNDADLSQRLPTYEDVLQADPACIVEAGYEEQGGLPCIYVAVEVPELGYLERYWVSVDTGLLVRAESSKEGEVFYRMSGFTVEVPAAPEMDFALPDGTVLHTTGPA